MSVELLQQQPQQLQQLYTQRLKHALDKVNKVIETAAVNNVPLTLNVSIKVLKKYNNDVLILDYES
jgi:hypothetical protein